MASFYEPMSGQAWRDELHSFLPHALDCVDSNCLLPLCVNLKLTLRHVQLCEKVDKCTICQGMKSLAATHSNSCRDYYCRVPFCMEAKVTTQQQILMDQLVKTSDAGLKSQTEDGQEGGKDNVSSKVTADSSLVLVASKATPKPVDSRKAPDLDGSPEQIAPSDKIWPTAECPQPGCKIPTQSPVSMESVQTEWMERSPFRSSAKLPKSSHPSAQGQLHGRLLVNSETSSPRNWCEQTSTATATDHAKDHAGVKRKLQSFISNNKSTPPSKVRRPSANEPDTQKEDCFEIEIVESKSSGRFARKANGAATSNDAKNRHQKRKPSNLEFLPKTPSRHVAIKQNKQASTMPVSSLPLYATKRNSLSKTSTLKTSSPGLQVTKDPVKAWYAMSDSSEMDLGPDVQVEDHITDDSVDCYIDEMFSTPPPSPTFGMWLGETIQTNDSTALKTVLLETLFQLLGVVTQPKTEQQEAVFVELLERTLRVMKTAIAK
ncbi:uncharacterized protein LOC144654666 [Oculina patagonica]